MCAAQNMYRTKLHFKKCISLPFNIQYEIKFYVLPHGFSVCGLQHTIYNMYYRKKYTCCFYLVITLTWRRKGRESTGPTTKLFLLVSRERCV